MSRRDQDSRREAPDFDHLLDGELSAPEMRAAYEDVAGDPPRRDELARTRAAIAHLRAPVDSPDLSEAILERVGRRRGFLHTRARRLVTAGRIAAAAGVVVTITLMSLAHRHSAELRLEAAPAPVSELVRSAEATAAVEPRIVDGAVERIQATISSPISRLTLDRRERPEERLRYDLATDRAPSATGRPHTRPDDSAIARSTGPAPAQAGGASPLLGRFGSVLVILREPDPLRVDANREHDDR